MTHAHWNGFTAGVWQDEINVRNFIQLNYTPYEGDHSFLADATPRTRKLMDKLQSLFAEERRRGGVLDVDVDTVSSLTSYAPGYLDKDNELIVGLQTDSPLKRGVNPFGGIRMVRQACAAYGYRLSDKVENEFKYRTTHNDGVFRAYTDEMRAARKCHVITGLPDAYGRGRIIGDYRRVALYGVDRLIAEKKKDKKALANGNFNTTINGTKVTKAKAGEVVTVNTTPADGFELKKITVTGTDNGIEAAKFGAEKIRKAIAEQGECREDEGEQAGYDIEGEGNNQPANLAQVGRGLQNLAEAAADDVSGDGQQEGQHHINRCHLAAVAQEAVSRQGGGACGNAQGDEVAGSLFLCGADHILCFLVAVELHSLKQSCSLHCLCHDNNLL